jgi:hypothetical protein
LNGHPHLKWGADAYDIQRQSATFYSFRADYGEIMRQAKAELVPLGYKFEEWKNGCYLQRGPYTDPVPMVVINRACRMTSTASAEQEKFWNEVPRDKGWVSVEVEGLTNPDWKEGR